ncbi:hypothetical protein ACNTMW_33895 [Planosporangium sp. 12N6]|uniref:hypothetical protein n=1 Tax=Planosporangium spinosum TaxID=3402278 RepID=UPI003CEC3ECA
MGLVRRLVHGTLLPRATGTTYYSPGLLTAALLHVPIGLTYLAALRAQGPIERGDWLKSLGVLAAWAVIGVTAPNVLGADKNSTNAFTPHQMGPFAARTSHITKGPDASA